MVEEQKTQGGSVSEHFKQLSIPPPLVTYSLAAGFG